MIKITNAAMVEDVALRSSTNYALQAASLAVDLVNGPPEVTAIEAMVTVVLDAAKTTDFVDNVARSISCRNRR